MGEPMNYDTYAEHYAYAREAVPWIVTPLVRAVRQLPAKATVVEIGCGTGNYIVALADALPDYVYKGFDLSLGMLEVAQARSTRVVFAQGNADVHFPYPDGCCHLAFAVDVIHHIAAPDVFFREAARVLTVGGVLLIITDSEDNLRTRSLTQYFPDVLAADLRRYPPLQTLHRAGLPVRQVEAAEGTIALDDAFIAKLEAKCSSGMRLISPEAHRQGMERVRQARACGEQWRSCYTVITYANGTS
jgi:SAM-dependent methyltransferase